jgi:hypothetical protein
MSIIIPANSAAGAGGYQVTNGVRFNSASSESLSRDPSSSGSLIGTNTISFWVKRSTDDTEAFLVYAIYDTNYRFKATFLANGKLQLNTIIGGSNNLLYETNRLFRDTSAWYHLVFAFDGRSAVSAGDRCRLYVNGVEETSFSTETDMGSDTSNFMSDANADVYIGAQATGNFFDGYISEFVFIDQQQLTPTSFGEFNEDSGVWQPLESVADLTFGTNGFYLNFQDSSALGNDVSGNNNDYTANNLAAIDQTTDTCTNNFATLNSLNAASGGTFTLDEGNLRVKGADTIEGYTSSTIGFSQGKWYFECESNFNTQGVVGITFDGNSGQVADDVRSDRYPGNATYSYGYIFSSGNKITNSSGSSYGNSLATGDILGVAIDLDNMKLYFSKNGTFQNSGVPTSGSTGTGAIDLTGSGSTGFCFVTVGDNNNGGYGQIDFNFGSPFFAISSGNADADGYGNFEYAVPSGYYAINTKNLAEYG